jgi:type IV secretion system protein VirB8
LTNKFELTKEHIISKQYFRDALSWYDGKFIFPIVHRSFLMIGVLFLILCLSVIGFQIKEQLPIVANIKYLININNDIYANTIIIDKDDSSTNSPLSFVAKILCENYIIKRENYDYEKLREQIIYVQKTSTKTLFKAFYDSLDTKNSSSPLTKYQKYGKRSVKIKNFSFLDDNNVIVDILAEARDMDNKIFETTEQQIKLSFESDDLTQSTKRDLGYKFLVTGYRIKNKE